MDVYQNLIFPVLSRMDAESAHERTIRLLEIAQYSSWGCWLLSRVAGKLPPRPVKLLGLTFPNEIGIAAGFDKDVRVALGLSYLGFGHVEVGTLTPYPQTGNARPRIFRLKKDQALINRMGFPNCGVHRASKRLKRLSETKTNLIVGVSLGKQKATPLESAANDYRLAMQEVYPSADYLAINISSPNTPGLRKLQNQKYLDQLVGHLCHTNYELSIRFGCDPLPLLLKLAPDLTWSEVDTILEVAMDKNIDGIIATNTTLSRDGLTSSSKIKKGGLSGSPLFNRSLEMITYIVGQMSGKLPIIGVGGVNSSDRAAKMLDAGASLVQIYTGFVYEGPRLAGRILRAL